MQQMSSLRESVVVSYGFHSDGSQLRGNNKQFHPVYVFLTCLPPSHFRQHDNYECVGMIPVLTWQQLGLPENMAANELKRYTSNITLSGGILRVRYGLHLRLKEFDYERV